jgi:hypothetical protein
MEPIPAAKSIANHAVPECSGGSSSGPSFTRPKPARGDEDQEGQEHGDAEDVEPSEVGHQPLRGAVGRPGPIGSVNAIVAMTKARMIAADPKKITGEVRSLSASWSLVSKGDHLLVRGVRHSRESCSAAGPPQGWGWSSVPRQYGERCGGTHIEAWCRAKGRPEALPRRARLDSRASVCPRAPDPRRRPLMSTPYVMPPTPPPLSSGDAPAEEPRPALHRSGLRLRAPARARRRRPSAWGLFLIGGGRRGGARSRPRP